jgi:hypothetical protein
VHSRPTAYGPIAVIPRAKPSPIAEVILISHFKIQRVFALACHAAFPEEESLLICMMAGSAP